MGITEISPPSPDPLSACAWTQAQSLALLEFYLAIGVDETLERKAIDRFAPPQPIVAPILHSEALAPKQIDLAHGQDSRAIAQACQNLAELEAALRGFTGCALQSTASRTVFADGNPNADLMIVGEAPGAEEDRLGKPFVGPSGQLLDRMLRAIGLDRASCYITNIVFWRPPFNRKPNPQEVAVCMPFVERHIALVQPKLLLLSGNSAASALLGRTEGIGRLRGQWFSYRPAPESPAIATLASFHPSYLLRQPAQKREAWNDFLALKARLTG